MEKREREREERERENFLKRPLAAFFRKKLIKKIPKIVNDDDESFFFSFPLKATKWRQLAHTHQHHHHHHHHQEYDSNYYYYSYSL